MSRRAVVLIVSLLLAGLAAFSVWQYLNDVEGNVRADISEVVVFRATTFVETGDDGESARGSIAESTALSESVVFEGSTILCTGPANREGSDVDFAVCDDNPSDLDALLSGSVAAGPISAGQLITSDMFVAPAELNLSTLSADIPQGKVAIAISPGNTGAVGGFIRPGDRVNLLATFNLDVTSLNDLLANPDTRELILASADLSGLLGGGSATQVIQDEEGNPIVVEAPPDPLSQYANSLPDSVDFTQTILQDLVVIAYGPETRDNPGALDDADELTGEEDVVLEVTPTEAEIIEFVRQRATLSLSLLPSEGEYSEFAASGVTVDDIFGFVDRIREQLEALGGS